MFYGRYWNLIKHYEVSHSQMLHEILGYDHIQWHPQLITYYTNLWTYYRTGRYYRFWLHYQMSGGFHRTFERVRLANRGRLLLHAPCPVPFRSCICSNVETISSWACHVFGLWISNIPRYFSFDRNRCVFKAVGAVFLFSWLLFSDGVGAFVIWLGQISCLFSVSDTCLLLSFNNCISKSR